MALLTVPTDVNIIKETVEYFRDLGFSEPYVRSIENELKEQESKLMAMLDLEIDPAQDDTGK